METKRCIRCGETKPTTEFYWRNRYYAKAGLVSSPMSKCKACTKKYAEARYRKRRPDVPEGMKWCGRCRKHVPLSEFGPNRARPDGVQNYCRRCQGLAVRTSERTVKELYGVAPVRSAPRALRRKATFYVALAIFFRDLTPKPCETCGAERVQAHHSDYLQPLCVTWLCRRCHAAVHGHTTGPFGTTTFKGREEDTT